MTSVELIQNAEELRVMGGSNKEVNHEKNGPNIRAILKRAASPWDSKSLEVIKHRQKSLAVGKQDEGFLARQGRNWLSTSKVLSNIMILW